MLNKYRAKPKGQMGVHCRSDGRQQLQSCTRGGILQAADGVHVTVLLCHFAFVSSERAGLRCSEPSAIDLFIKNPCQKQDQYL